MKIKKFSPSGKKPDRDDENEKKPRRADADRVNRTVYLTVATLLIILAVCVALTSAANRARRGEADLTSGAAPESTAAPVVKPPVTDLPAVTDKEPADTKTPTGKPDKPVADEVPTFILPVNGKLGASHDPTAQVFSDTMKDWRVHLGIDIQAKAGDAVYAAANGKVTKIWDDPLYGKSVTIGHTGKAVTVYKNLAGTLADGVEVGSEVKAGQVIGAVGDGAMIELADEPHIHFEVKIDDVSVNPLDYLSKSALKTLEDDTAFEH